MGLLIEILAFPLLGPLRGLTFIAEKVKEMVDAELAPGEDQLRGQLFELELRRELEDLSEGEYLAEESALLERLDLLQEEREAA